MNPTIATVKSFIRHNRPHLLIRVRSDFDGMTDCVRQNHGATWRPPMRNEDSASWDNKYTLGVSGVWFVGRSRDYVNAINETGLTGYEVSNCCGSWAVAVATEPKPETQVIQ